MTTLTPTAPHPATFSPTILTVLVDELLAEHYRFWLRQEPTGPRRLLDPFAGIGTIHEIEERTAGLWKTTGVELEPEWACAHPQTITGDSTEKHFEDGTFDAIVTSPTYGNRMADKYDGKGRCRKCRGDDDNCSRCEGTGVDQSKRRTYRIFLGRMPSENSTTVLQWGKEYRDIHTMVWARCVDALVDGGIFLLNSKDHQRKDERQHVTDWHVETLEGFGLTVEQRIPVETPHYGFGQNAEHRFAEEVIRLRKVS